MPHNYDNYSAPVNVFLPEGGEGRQITLGNWKILERRDYPR